MIINNFNLLPPTAYSPRGVCEKCENAKCKSAFHAHGVLKNNTPRPRRIALPHDDSHTIITQMFNCLFLNVLHAYVRNTMRIEPKRGERKC